MGHGPKRMKTLLGGFLRLGTCFSVLGQSSWGTVPGAGWHVNKIATWDATHPMGRGRARLCVITCQSSIKDQTR